MHPTGASEAESRVLQAGATSRGLRRYDRPVICRHIVESDLQRIPVSWTLGMTITPKGLLLENHCARKTRTPERSDRFLMVLVVADFKFPRWLRQMAVFQGHVHSLSTPLRRKESARRIRQLDFEKVKVTNHPHQCLLPHSIAEIHKVKEASFRIVTMLPCAQGK